MRIHLLSLVILTVTLVAATADAAVIEGRVLGPDGAPVPGVTITLSDAIMTPVVSDADGRYRIENVAPGNYRLLWSLVQRPEPGPTVSVAQPADVVSVADIVVSLAMSEEVAVKADTWTLPIDIPNSTASRTAEQLDAQNMINPEDMLRFVPNTTIRKRYIGDRNGLVAGRNFNTVQPGRALVYLEGYLLSNFLGRFDAPRWNMLTPAAIERVDVLYGPFSAIHPGNSIGTTVVVTERSPEKLEWNVAVTGYGQNFDQYNDAETFRGGQSSVYLGKRFNPRFWSSLTFNHQDNTGQPMQWFNVTRNAVGDFPATTGPATPVSGIRYDADYYGRERAVFGSNNGAIDHTVQDSLKGRVGVMITPTLEASALVGGWRNDTETRNKTFLRDSAGNAVWQGVVTDGVNSFTIPATAMSPFTRAENHLQLGTTVRTRRPVGWNLSFIGSYYTILDDAQNRALTPDPVAAGGGAGTVTRRDGTGWNTAEVQSTYTPREGDWTRNRHALTFGIHRNGYTLDNAVTNASDWRSVETSLSQRYLGETEIVALYAQDAVVLRHDLKLTLGLRSEFYRTFDGRQVVRVATCVPSAEAECVPTGDNAFNKTVSYAERTLTGQSPKASLAWTATHHLILRGSFGRGVRFPNVEELYNGTVTAQSVITADPNLRAERSNAVDGTAEIFFGTHTARVSVFHDQVRDAIYRQQNVTVFPNVTNVSNVDKVRTSGLELVWNGRNVRVSGLNIDATMSFTNSKVVENQKDPGTEGKFWPVIPKTRGNVLVSYLLTPKWMASVGYRHQGSAFNDIYNLDTNPNVFGGASRLNQFDVRTTYRLNRLFELAAGIDNLTDQRAFEFHPYPGRMFSFQFKTYSF